MVKKVQSIVRLHSPMEISNNDDCTSSDDDACDMDMEIDFFKGNRSFRFFKLFIALKFRSPVLLRVFTIQQIVRYWPLHG